MKSLARAVSVSMFVLVMLAVVANVYAGRDRTTICHKPGTPAEQTKSVPNEAVFGHRQHGDTLGACDPAPAPVATQTTAPTATPTTVPTAAPTNTPVKPTNTPQPRETEVIETIETVEATSTPVPITPTQNSTSEPSCAVSGGACDPCELLLQAMREGMAVVITDGDNVTIVDGQVTVNGGTLATGLLSETR